MPESSSRRQLIGYGRLSWGEIQQKLDGAVCTWMDLDGSRVAQPLPVARPCTTHVWAHRTDGGSLYRVRIDGDEGIVAELEMGQAGDAPHGEAAEGRELVDVLEYRVRVWPETEGRLSEATREALPGSVTVHEVQGSVPLQFLRVEMRGEES